VILVVFDGVQSLDATGPIEVLTRGGQLAEAPYDIELSSSLPAPAPSPRRAASASRSAPRRAFLRHVRVPPSEYRKRFRKEPA